MSMFEFGSRDSGRVAKNVIFVNTRKVLRGKEISLNHLAPAFKSRIMLNTVNSCISAEECPQLE